MPKNPLDILKALALKNVPKATPEQEENRDFRAQAIQDQEPTWKKLGRGAMESLTGFLVEDPFTDSESVQKGITKPSPGANAGMLAAAAPFSPGSIKRLPAIAPEAYRDVKAGGLRLYSRLTDAMMKAPKAMNPDKVRSVAKAGTSAEEISLRKLEDFLKGRQPMDKVSRDDVMGHLEANPIELDVVRKGVPQPDGRSIGEVQNSYQQAAAAERAFEHELDTRYGIGWVTQQQRDGGVQSLGPIISADDADRLIELGNARARVEVSNNHTGDTRWSSLQTPGPMENYGETLINLPDKSVKVGPQVPDGVGGLTQPRIGDAPFKSSHWDEPNNLVWSRHNDRRLNPTSTTPDILSQPQDIDEFGRVGSWDPPVAPTASGGSKGRFVEEIQSDWHQQGRELGYKGETLPINLQNTPIQNISWLEGDLNNLDAYNRNLEAARPPDAPFKETYPDLALKQQLLDAANDPELEWLGVADADTVSAMEGHSSVRPGTELYYNQKHPSALEKLLSPLGGKVEYDTINNISVPSKNELNFGPTWNNSEGPHGIRVISPRESIGQNVSHPIASILPDSSFDTVTDQMKFPKQVPGQGMWKANLPPELKELIKQRGFPAMTALLALQQMFSGQDEQ